MTTTITKALENFCAAAERDGDPAFAHLILDGRLALASLAGQEPVAEVKVVPRDGGSFILGWQLYDSLPFGTHKLYAHPPAEVAGQAQGRRIGALLTKLPTLDPSWSDEVRDGWLRCFNAMQELATAPSTPSQAAKAEDSTQGAGELLDAAQHAADVLAELYAKYQTKIGPFASQAQKANVMLGSAIAKALASAKPAQPAEGASHG